MFCWREMLLLCESLPDKDFIQYNSKGCYPLLSFTILFSFCISFVLFLFSLLIKLTTCQLSLIIVISWWVEDEFWKGNIILYAYLFLHNTASENIHLILKEVTFSCMCVHAHTHNTNLLPMCIFLKSIFTWVR